MWWPWECATEIFCTRTYYRGYSWQPSFPSSSGTPTVCAMRPHYHCGSPRCLSTAQVLQHAGLLQQRAWSQESPLTSLKLCYSLSLLQHNPTSFPSPFRHTRPASWSEGFSFWLTFLFLYPLSAFLPTKISYLSNVLAFASQRSQINTLDLLPYNRVTLSSPYKHNCVFTQWLYHNSEASIDLFKNNFAPFICYFLE